MESLTCQVAPFATLFVSCPPMARASSSQIFEPAVRPPSSRFSRRSRADPAAHFSSISCGKCSSPCCGNFRKISAEILREILRNFQHENFLIKFRKFVFQNFPLEILRIFKVKMLKIFSARFARGTNIFPFEILTYSHLYFYYYQEPPFPGAGKYFYLNSPKGKYPKKTLKNGLFYVSL